MLGLCLQSLNPYLNVKDWNIDGLLQAAAMETWLNTWNVKCLFNQMLTVLSRLGIYKQGLSLK